jgi:Putative beta-barrel porin-2, OmpL-like. bbp2
MLHKFFVAALATGSLFISNQVLAQEANVPAATVVAENAPDPEPEKKPTLAITGYADIYYKYDFGKTKGNNYTSFTNSHNSFALGMASVKLEHKTDKVGVVADLGFGTRQSEFAYNETGILSTIKQLYVSYSPNSWLKLTAGTWATHIGYELVDPQLNRNYSMSYMFTNGPFTHTGVKAEATSGKHGFMLGVSNVTDYRIPPSGQINKKFLLAQYSVAFTDNVKLYLNYVGGKNPDTSKVSQFDAVLTAKVNDKLSFGYNGTVNSTKAWDGAKNIAGKSWWGSALYVNLDPKPWFGLTLRGELFSDKNQLKVFAPAADGGSIFATTLSANFKVDGFTFIPEFRLDNATQQVFVNKDGAATKSAGNFLFAVIYSF